MAVDPVTGKTLPPIGSSTSSTSSTQGGFNASSDMFMKLLVANMQNQDPMQPTDSSSYMQQLSQMTTVEKLTSIDSTSTSSAKDQARATAVQMLGKQVTYTDGDGNPQSGVVSRIEVSGNSPSLTIGGQGGIDLSAVTEVVSA
jgi:flagellar basal-body rod modification protein FlgD